MATAPMRLHDFLLMLKEYEYRLDEEFRSRIMAARFGGGIPLLCIGSLQQNLSNITHRDHVDTRGQQLVYITTARDRDAIENDNAFQPPLGMQWLCTVVFEGASDPKEVDLDRHHWCFINYDPKWINPEFFQRSGYWDFDQMAKLKRTDRVAILYEHITKTFEHEQYKQVTPVQDLALKRQRLHKGYAEHRQLIEEQSQRKASEVLTQQNLLRSNDEVNGNAPEVRPKMIRREDDFDIGPKLRRFQCMLQSSSVTNVDHLTSTPETRAFDEASATHTTTLFAVNRAREQSAEDTLFVSERSDCAVQQAASDQLLSELESMSFEEAVKVFSQAQQDPDAEVSGRVVIARRTILQRIRTPEDNYPNKIGRFLSMLRNF